MRGLEIFNKGILILKSLRRLYIFALIATSNLFDLGAEE